MGFFSNIFTTDKKSRIEVLKKQIEGHKKVIATIKINMEQYRRIKAAKHYQEGGKVKIETQNHLIRMAKAEISRLKK